MIKIDPQFKALCRALTKDEYEYLETSLQDDGCDNPIILWNDTIVDGHNRYEICQKHGIEFNILNKEFESREDAMLWIIHNQLARRNLSDLDRVALLEAKRPLLAKQARERQRAAGENYGRGKVAANLPEPINTGETSEKLAVEAGVSRKTYDALYQRGGVHCDSPLMSCVPWRGGDAGKIGIVALLAKQAKERQKAGLKQGDKIPVGVNLPQREDAVKVRDQLASEAGMSGKTYDSLRKVNENGTLYQRGRKPMKQCPVCKALSENGDGACDVCGHKYSRMSRTEELLKDFENEEFISREQAAQLAKQAFADYTRRSKAAKNVDRAVYDMVLAGGCPNAVRERVETLVG